MWLNLWPAIGRLVSTRDPVPLARKEGGGGEAPQLGMVNVGKMDASNVGDQLRCEDQLWSQDKGGVNHFCLERSSLGFSMLSP